MKKLTIVLLLMLSIQIVGVSAMSPIEPPFGVHIRIDNCKSYDKYVVKVYVKKDELPYDLNSDDLPDDTWVSVEELDYITVDEWDCNYVFDFHGDIFSRRDVSSFRVEVYHNDELVDEIKQYSSDITLSYDFRVETTYYIIHVNTASESFTLERMEFDSVPFGTGLAKFFGFILMLIVVAFFGGLLTLVEVIIASSRTRRTEVGIGIVVFNIFTFTIYLAGLLVGSLNSVIYLTGLAVGLLGFKLFLASRNSERVMKLYVFSSVFYIGIMGLLYFIAEGNGFLDF